jgi:hypothetical protein
LTGVTETVVRLVEVLRGGSSFPCIAETDTGRLIVLKLAGTGPGPRGLLTEFLAGRIAGGWLVPVPEVRPVLLPDTIPWQVGTDEFDEMLQRSFGWNLGVAFVPDARTLAAQDLAGLPAAFLACLRRADRLLQNMDRTARNPNLLRGADGGLWAIDHDACLFLERILSGRRPFSFSLPRTHFLAAREAPPGMDVPAADAGLIGGDPDALVDEVPESWMAEIPATRGELARGLADYIDAFSRCVP